MRTPLFSLMLYSISTITLIVDGRPSCLVKQWGLCHTRPHSR